MLRGAFFQLVIGCFALLTAPIALAANSSPAKTQDAPKPQDAFYRLQAKNIDGKSVSFSEFKGKVLLIVNTASQCGYTPQYKGLQELYERYKDKGLVVLGFPSNDFGGQEPGTNLEVKKFCEFKYKVTFPMFEKVVVKGDNKHPVYRYLTEKQPNSETKKEPTWNFTKYVIDRSGNVVSVFPSDVEPTDKKITDLLDRSALN